MTLTRPYTVIATWRHSKSNDRRPLTTWQSKHHFISRKSIIGVMWRHLSSICATMTTLTMTDIIRLLSVWRTDQTPFKYVTFLTSRSAPGAWASDTRSPAFYRFLKPACIASNMRDWNVNQSKRNPAYLWVIAAVCSQRTSRGGRLLAAHPLLKIIFHSHFPLTGRFCRRRNHHNAFMFH